MKKSLSLLLILLTLTGCSATIGTVNGPEWDSIFIDGIEYIRVDAVPDEYDIYSGADKGTKLGIINSGDETLHVYTIKGETQQNYLYVRWEWEGDIYVRRDYAGE